MAEILGRQLRTEGARAQTFDAAIKEAVERRRGGEMRTLIDNKIFASELENIWRMCNSDKEGFRKYLQEDALSLRNLDWLFRHEMTRRYLGNALAEIDKDANGVAFGCVSRIRDLFALDINVNDGGDPDALSDFTQVCRSLLAEFRADLHEHSSYNIFFTPLEIYLADIETGTFGFYPGK